MRGENLWGEGEKVVERSQTWHPQALWMCCRYPALILHKESLWMKHLKQQPLAI